MASPYLLLIVALPVLAESPLPVRLGTVVEFPAAPEIDGVLDDACWVTASALDDFTCVMTREGAPDAEVSARAGYDARALYVAIRCGEPLMEEALAIAGSGDPFNECVEMFVDANHDRHTYRQFRLGVTGAMEHRRGSVAEEAPWRAAVARGTGGWTAEIAVSWSLLGARPETGQAIGFNLNRIRMGTSPAEFACWAPTPEGFHAPDRFGVLVMGGYDAWVRRAAGGTVGGMGRRIREMIERYPESTRALRDRAGELDAYVDVTERYARMARDEASALAAWAGLAMELEEAQELYRAVRLAVIEGEFR